MPDALALLLRRLRYLSGVLPAGQEVLFYLSRLPPPEAGTFGEREARLAVRAAADIVGADASLDEDRLVAAAVRRAGAPPAAAADANASLHPTLALDAPPPPHLALLCALLSPLLAAALAQLPATATGPPRELSLLDPLPTRHLKPDATAHSSAQQLDVPAVVRTLVRLFQRGALHAPPPPPAESALLSAAALLPICFRETSQRLADGTFELWLSERAWERFLEDRHDELELPAAALLRAFRPLARALAAAGLAVAHHAGGCADLAIELEFRADDGRVTRRRWRPPAADDDASAADAPLIRLPYHPPLLAAIEQQLARGLPTRWWLRVDDAAQLVPAVALDAAALRTAEGSLRAAVQAQLLRVRAAAPTSWAVLVVLLEDWCLARALLRRASGEGERLALSLFSPEEHWHGEIEPYVDEAAATGAAAWTIELRVAADEKEWEGCVPCDSVPCSA